MSSEVAEGIHFKAIRNTIQNTSLVFPSGTISLAAKDLILYYGKDGPTNLIGCVLYKIPDVYLTAI